MMAEANDKATELLKQSKIYYNNNEMNDIFIDLYMIQAAALMNTQPQTQ
jgi:hypothetical protein